MTFTKFLPIPIIIGILAAFSLFVANWLAIPVWMIFISWALYFIAGAKPSRLPKEVIGLAGGVAFGYITLWAMPYFTNVFGSVFGLPATVFVVCFIIVLLELTDWFELAPAYFFSFAGYFAYVFGSGGGPGTTPENSLWPVLLASIVGLAFGYVSAYLRTAILEKEGVFGSAQQTVFDKEARV